MKSISETSVMLSWQEHSSHQNCSTEQQAVMAHYNYENVSSCILNYYSDPKEECLRKHNKQKKQTVVDSYREIQCCFLIIFLVFVFFKDRNSVIMSQKLTNITDCLGWFGSAGSLTPKRPPAVNLCLWVSACLSRPWVFQQMLLVKKTKKQNKQPSHPPKSSSF